MDRNIQLKDINKTIFRDICNNLLVFPLQVSNEYQVPAFSTQQNDISQNNSYSVIKMCSLARREM